MYQLGATAAAVRRSYYAARARLIAHPVPQQSGPSIGPDELDDTFVAGGYNDGYWPELAAATAAYLHGGSTEQLVTVFNQIGKQSENEFAVYNAVECADVAWPRSWAKWNADTRKVYSTAPFEAWDNAWFNAACAFWPVHGPAKPMKIGAPGLPGILMLQGTLDAATPYAGRPGRPPAAADSQDGGGTRRRQPRAVTRVPRQYVRQWVSEQIPRDRGASVRLRAGECDVRPAAHPIPTPHTADGQPCRIAVTLKGCCAPGLGKHPRSGS